MSIVTCGVDLGLDGAITFYNHDKDVFKVYDMPVLTKKVMGKNRKFVDYDAVKQIFFEQTFNKKCNKIFIEVAPAYLPKNGRSSIGGMGATSAKKTGISEGFFIGLSLGMGFEYELIRPQTWMKLYGIGSKYGNTKIQGENIVNKKYPYIETRTKRGKLLDGRVDSVLICLFGTKVV